MPLDHSIPRRRVRQRPWALLVLLALAPSAGALTGVLERAAPAFLVIDGERYRVGRDVRLLTDAERDIYSLTSAEMEALPRFEARRLRAVHRVRVRLEGGRVRVVQPLEYRR